MNYLMRKGQALLDAVDTVLNYKDLRSNQNPEVRRFIEEYHALAFDLSTYRNTPATMTIEPGLAELIVARIDAMNEMLLAYQSDCDRNTFNDALVLRDAYRMDMLMEARREIQGKIDAAAQQALAAAAYEPAPHLGGPPSEGMPRTGPSDNPRSGPPNAQRAGLPYQTIPNLYTHGMPEPQTFPTSGLSSFPNTAQSFDRSLYPPPTMLPGYPQPSSAMPTYAPTTIDPHMAVIDLSDHGQY